MKIPLGFEKISFRSESILWDMTIPIRCSVKNRQGVSAHTQLHSQRFYDCVVDCTIIYVSDMIGKS